MSANIDSTLASRSALYGNYRAGLELETHLMRLIKSNYRVHNNGEEIDPLSEAMIHKVIVKIGRLSVTPHHIDSWHDIQGYAKLAEDAIHDINERSNKLAKASADDSF